MNDKLNKLTQAAKELNALHVEVSPMADRVNFYVNGINFAANTRDARGKYTIRACMPRIDHQVNDCEARKKWDEITKTIRVSDSKTAETIAKDILRRFDFAALGEAYEAFVEAQHWHDNYKSEHKALVKRIVDSTGFLAHSSDDTTTTIDIPTKFNCYGEIEVHGTHVDIRIRGIKTEEQTMKILSAFMSTVEIEE